VCQSNLKLLLKPRTEVNSKRLIFWSLDSESILEFLIKIVLNLDFASVISCGARVDVVHFVIIFENLLDVVCKHH